MSPPCSAQGIARLRDELVSAARADVRISAAALLGAVGRILDEDFPMRPHPDKCPSCDFRSLCPKRLEEFKTDERPPPLQIPAQGTGRVVSAFEVAPVEEA